MGAKSGEFCPICCETRTRSELFPLISCPHAFCTECLRSYVTVSLDSQARPQLFCPRADCTASLHPKDVEKLLGHSEKMSENPEKMEERKNYLLQWERLQVRQAFLGSRDLRWCPMENCHFASLLPPGGPRLCPSFHCDLCAKDYCSKCYGEWKQGHSCAQKGIFDTTGKAHGSSNRRHSRRKLLGGNVKKCPVCRVLVTKEGGCNFVLCPVCACEFCWFCGQPEAENGNCFAHWTSFCRLRGDRITKRLTHGNRFQHLWQRLLLAIALLVVSCVALPLLVTWTLCVGFPYNFCKDAFYSTSGRQCHKRALVMLISTLFLIVCICILPLAWLVLYFSCSCDVLNFACELICSPSRRENNNSQ